MTRGVSLRGVLEDALAQALARLGGRSMTARASAPLLGSGDGRAHVLALGKAAAHMAAGLHEVAGERIARTLVITKDGHAGAEREPGILGVPARGMIEVIEAAHPVPDVRSLAAGRRALELVASVPEDGRLVVLLSGGGSSLCSVPADGLSLDDKATAVRALLAAGAPIHALAAVRKHLSGVKGGRLALASRAPVRVLAISDVVGDDPAAIAGGPFTADPSTYAEALEVLDELAPGAAPAARAVLDEGVRGLRDETPREGDPRLDRVELAIAAGPDAFVDAIASALEASGIAVLAKRPRVTSSVERVVGDLLATARALAARVVATGEPCAAVLGGEPTLALHGEAGRGGRAQHAALVAARGLVEAATLAGAPGVELVVLASASDGTDGPTDDAGGIVDSGSWERMARAGVDPAVALRHYDAGTALEAAGDLVTTGPTGTNVCDIYVVAAAPVG